MYKRQAGLDPIGRDEILARIREYHQSEKVAVLLVSHSMEDVANNAQKVMVMHQSRLEMFDNTKEIFREAERLTKIGLDVPQITGIFLKMKQHGYDVDSAIYSPSAAAEEIERLYKTKLMKESS